MKKIKIGINGFGRIGRMVLRSAVVRGDIEVVAINDLLDIKHLAYLLKYDSVHGVFDAKISHDESNLYVNDQKIIISAQRNPNEISWDSKGVDVVLECTGLFTTLDTAKLHLDGGAPKVVISAPSKDAPMFVMGVNHKDVKSTDLIISNASCTTNCLAPPIKVLNDNFGVEEADLQLKTCTENDLIFKRKAREALILNIDPDVFSDNVAGSTDTINITDLEDEGVIFLVYDGSITDTHICSVIAPITPNITERWEATAGTITINTVAASGNTGVNHEITFTNMVFTKVSDTSGQTFAISDLIVPEPGETGYYFGLYVP